MKIKLTITFLALTLVHQNVAASFPLQEPVTAKGGSASIAGRVTVGGKPAPGIAVIATPYELSPETIMQTLFGRMAMFKTSTEQDGQYRITGIPAGRYKVEAFAPTHVGGQMGDSIDSENRVTLSDGEAREGIDFDLEPGAVITGTITDSSGRPLIREFVNIYRIGEAGKKVPVSIPSEDSGMFLTDDRGIYRIYGLSADRYLVSVGEGGGQANPFISRPNTRRTFYPDATDESKAKIVELTAGAEATGIDIRMAPPGKGYTASGRTVDGQTGKPISNTMIYLNRVVKDDDLGPVQPVTSVSNAQGEFRIENLQQGAYMASVFFTGQSDYYGDRITFEIKNTDLSGLDIKLHRGGSIEGTLLVENSTDPDVNESFARLVIMARVTGGDKTESGFGRGQANPDGSFRISGLAAGRAHIMVEEYLSPAPLRLSRVEREGVLQQDGITIGPGENISGVRLILVQAASSIRGRAVFEGGSLPADTEITVFANRPGEERFGFGGGMAEVKPDGSFVIEKLQPGDYELQFFATPGRDTRDTDEPQPIHRQTVTVNATGPTEVIITINLKQKDRD